MFKNVYVTFKVHVPIKQRKVIIDNPFHTRVNINLILAVTVGNTMWQIKQSLVNIKSSSVFISLARVNSSFT